MSAATTPPVKGFTLLSHQSSFRSFGIVDVASKDVYALGLQQITKTQSCIKAQGSGPYKHLSTQQSLDVLPAQNESDEEQYQFERSGERQSNKYLQVDDDAVSRSSSSSSIDLGSQNDLQFPHLESGVKNTNLQTQTQFTIDIILMQEMPQKTLSALKEEEKDYGQVKIKSLIISMDEDGSFRLMPLLEQLEKLGHKLNGSTLWYYSDWSSNYVHVGRYPSQEVKECLVPHSTIDLEAGRLIIKTSPIQHERKNSRALDELLSPAARQATAATSPCLYTPNKPQLKREMTADFKSNRYHGERVQQSVRAVGEKKDVKLRSHLLPPQLQSFSMCISAKDGILSPVILSPCVPVAVENQERKDTMTSIIQGEKPGRTFSQAVSSPDQPRGISMKQEKLPSASRRVMKAQEQASQVMMQSECDSNQNLSKSVATNSKNNQFKRVKERTIKEVIRKVCVWRRLYNGILRADGTLVRYSLENAARKSEMSKKSLDDYLHQIRLATKYKFDFKNRQDEKFGSLRSFIRQMRSREAEDQVQSAQGMEIDQEK